MAKSFMDQEKGKWFNYGYRLVLTKFTLGEIADPLPRLTMSQDWKLACIQDKFWRLGQDAAYKEFEDDFYPLTESYKEGYICPR